MSLSSLLVLCVSVAVCLVAASAQTTIYFTAQSASGYPATCTSGTLSCSVNGTGYACGSGGVTGGTHWYYPSATAPTFAAQLVNGTTPTLCEQYYADFQLPLTTSGLNVQYGTATQQTCVNYRVRNSSTTVLIAVPDAVEAVGLAFTYGTAASSAPSCPAPVAASSSGAATVYFTYSGVNTTGGTSICGSGSLACTAYGNNQYYCPQLNSGTHYQTSGATGSAITTVSLSSETECNGFGDGYLPLSYEGISFAGSFSSSFQCISWYGTGGGTSQGYDFYNTNSIKNYTSYSGTKAFAYSTTATTPQAACAALAPFASLNSGGGNSNNTGAASAVGSSVVSAGMAVIAAVAATLAL